MAQSRISRRRFVGGAAAMSLSTRALLARPKRPARPEPARLLVGTQTDTGTSKGIYSYHFDPGPGALAREVLAAACQQPTFLALSPDRRLVYAVHETANFEGTGGGSLSSFALDREAGMLHGISEVATEGAAPCYVTTDHSGRCVFAANYTGGSAASFTADREGHLSRVVSLTKFTGHGPDKERQEAPHAHRVTVSPKNGFVLVNDLGTDKIHIFHLNSATAALTPNDPPAWDAAPGAGPRALRFHPNGKWAYCVNELQSTVDLLLWNSLAGTLVKVQETRLLPDGFSGVARASEIVVDKAGRLAYVAVRDNNFLAGFSIDPPTGKLTPLGHSSCGGKIPRHIALDPSERWLLVANQESDNIAIFARDPNTGHLGETSQSFPVSRPQCLLFV